MDNLPLTHSIIGSTAGILLLLVVIELVRRRQLKIQYSVLWVASAIAAVLFVLLYDWIMGIASSFELAPISVSFFLAIFFLILVILYLSVRISHLETSLKNLVQQYALDHGRREEPAVNENVVTELPSDDAT